MSHLTGSAAACGAYAATVARVLGLPRRGEHVGRGRHVDLDAPARVGWTTAWAVPRKHPTRDEWAVEVLDAQGAFELADASPEDLEALGGAVWEARDLDASWEPAELVAAEEVG